MGWAKGRVPAVVELQCPLQRHDEQKPLHVTRIAFRLLAGRFQVFQRCLAGPARQCHFAHAGLDAIELESGSSHRRHHKVNSLLVHGHGRLAYPNARQSRPRSNLRTSSRTCRHCDRRGAHNHAGHALGRLESLLRASLFRLQPGLRLPERLAVGLGRPARRPGKDLRAQAVRDGWLGKPRALAGHGG